MTLMIGLHHFLEMSKNVGQDYVSGIVHEKNMEKNFQTKKSIIFIIIINDNTM
jgi:hypothetical protein